MDQNDYPPLWMGRCEGCGASYDLDDALMREQHPVDDPIFADGEFDTDCPKCDTRFTLTRTTVKVVPFSAWDVLPPASGCPICGREHDVAWPHDARSMTYLYWFRSQEAKAGREERWPTWHDAMAHCTPQVKAGWVKALLERGVDLDT